MAWYASNRNLYKARQYEAWGKDLQKEQERIEFGRSLLENIRQARIQQAQEDYRTYLEGGTVSSSRAGAISSIQSSLAGAVGQAYSDSATNQQLQEYNALAEHYYKRHAKKVERQGATVKYTAMAIGALAGGIGAGLVAGGMSAMTGATVGASLGSATGNASMGNWKGAAIDVASAALTYGTASTGLPEAAKGADIYAKGPTGTLIVKNGVSTFKEAGLLDTVKASVSSFGKATKELYSNYQAIKPLVDNYDTIWNNRRSQQWNL